MTGSSNSDSRNGGNPHAPKALGPSRPNSSFRALLADKAADNGRNSIKPSVGNSSSECRRRNIVPPRSKLYPPAIDAEVHRVRQPAVTAGHSVAPPHRLYPAAPSVRPRLLLLELRHLPLL